MANVFLIESEILKNDICHNEFSSLINDEDFIITSNRKLISELNLCCNVIEMTSYENDKELNEIVLGIQNKSGIDKLFSISEFDIIRAAKIRERYSIPGQSPSEANIFRDKLLMKEHFKINDIRCAKFLSIQSTNDLFRFSKENGLPIVLKPRNLAGSQGVLIIKSEKQLESVLCTADFKNEFNDYMVEKFVEGDMYHIDGLIIDGKIKEIIPSKYHTTTYEYTTGQKEMITAVISKTDPGFSDLLDFTENLISKMPFEANAVFHLEVFQTPQGEIVACEIAARMGGARVSETIRNQTGIDFVTSKIKSDLGIYEEKDRSNSANKSYGFVLMKYKDGKLTRIKKECDLPYSMSFRLDAKIGSTYVPKVNSGKSFVSSIIEGNCNQEVIENAKSFIRWAESNFCWELNEEKS